jgi:autotransporter-associated beta strand protein
MEATAGNATITVSSGKQTISAPVALNSNLTVTATGPGVGLTISGDVSGTGKSLGVTGNLTLSGHNTYSGGTSVDGGSVTFSNALALPHGSNVTVSGSGVVVFSSGYTGVITSGGSGPAPAMDSPAPVPEPGTIVLLAAAALMGAGAWLRRNGRAECLHRERRRYG